MPFQGSAWWVSAWHCENDLKLRMERSKHTVQKGDHCKESPEIINNDGDQRWKAGLLALLPLQHPVEPWKGLLGTPYTWVIHSTNKWALNTYNTSCSAKMLGIRRQVRYGSCLQAVPQSISWTSHLRTRHPSLAKTVLVYAPLSNVIINSVHSHSLKCSGLDDKLYGHLNYSTVCRQW